MCILPKGVGLTKVNVILGVVEFEFHKSLLSLFNREKNIATSS